MKRRLMQLLFTAGLLLTLAAGTLWVRSLWVTDVFTLSRQWAEPGEFGVNEFVQLNTGRSCFQVMWGELGPAGYLTPSAKDRESAPWQVSHHAKKIDRFRPAVSRSTRWSERLGFFRWSGSGMAVEAVGVPSWLVVLIPAALTAPAALWLRRDRRRRVRASQALCITCGYDLRGAAHERCPECGAAVPAAAPVAV